MSKVHVLFPTVWRDPIDRFRERFPVPWSVEECEGGYCVLDARDVRLITFSACGQGQSLKQCGSVSSHLSRPIALTLARAIARMGSRRE